ncbi:MAG: hypothetical protein GX230_11545 [Lentisphaerae bacterium]|jgi:3-oxoacyl-[acyl-carrier-protein] synthase II|nr:hypothetical protein [Lentisphaerota bacterium]
MIAITSIGVMSPLGIDPAEITAALREGESAAFPSDTHMHSDGTPWLAAEVPPFKITEYITPKPFLDRNSALLLAACGSALQAAACDPKSLPEGRCGIAVGTLWGGLDTLDLFFSDYLAKGPRLVKPLLFPHTYANTAISMAAMEWALTGEHHNFVSDRTASGQAICEAAAIIAESRADLMLAAGTEAISGPLLRYLDYLTVASPTPIIPAEAGAALVLEHPGKAAARGVTPLAHISGYATATTAATALTAALERAATTADAVGWGVISTADTPHGEAEANALTTITGNPHLPLVAPLALCGEMYGATTAFLTACAALMLNQRFIAPVVPANTCSTIPAGACAIVTAADHNATALILN